MNVGKCAKCKYESYDNGKSQKALYKVRYTKTYRRAVICEDCLNEKIEKGIEFLEVLKK